MDDLFTVWDIHYNVALCKVKLQFFFELFWGKLFYVLI